MPKAVASKPFVPFWKTLLGEPEADRLRQTLLDGRLSMGAVTEEFEERFAKTLGMPYAVCTTSGSAAIYLACTAAGLKLGDEVICPNRTFVATAHAAMLAGAGIRLVDVHKDDTLIDEDAIEARLTPKTKAIIVVHLNGNSVDMAKVNKLAKKKGLKVIEDAAQAFYSKDKNGYLGAQSDLGCFSLGVTKLITTGQGGVVVTKSKELRDRLALFRNHGVSDTYSAKYEHFGFNLKYTDLLASVGLVQLGRVEQKKAAHLKLYRHYHKALRGLDFIKVLTVKEDQGNLPLWVEALVSERDRAIELLSSESNVQCRPYLPDLDRSSYLGAQGADFPNSRRFSRHGLFLPSGPDLSQEAAEQAVEALKGLAGRLAPLK